MHYTCKKYLYIQVYAAKDEYAYICICIELYFTGHKLHAIRAQTTHIPGQGGILYCLYLYFAHPPRGERQLLHTHQALAHPPKASPKTEFHPFAKPGGAF